MYNLAIYAADIGLPGHGTLMTWKQCVDLCLAADVCAAVCSLAPMFNGNTYCKVITLILGYEKTFAHTFGFSP